MGQSVIYTMEIGSSNPYAELFIGKINRDFTAVIEISLSLCFSCLKFSHSHSWPCNSGRPWKKQSQSTRGSRYRPSFPQTEIWSLKTQIWSEEIWAKLQRWPAKTTATVSGDSVSRDRPRWRRLRYSPFTTSSLRARYGPVTGVTCGSIFSVTNQS